MENAHQFLGDLALVLFTAGAATVLFQRLRLPVIFGYIFAGFLISPHFTVFPVAANEETVHTLSELGVILLMFALGLHFSLRRLMRILPTAGVVAVAECSVLILLGYLMGQAFGWTTLESVFTGAIVAIASTTVIVKAFEEQNARGDFKDIVLGILIAEDLIAILLLAVLTTATAPADLSLASLGSTAARLTVFLIAFLVIGLLTIPRTIRYIVGLKRAETVVIVGSGLAFAGSLIALRFGYSVALGAFMAGALAGESGVARTVEHLIQPVRDLFVAIFFVAVGMLIDPLLIVQHWSAVIALSLLVIMGKVLAVSLSCVLTGYSVRTSVQAGMSLAQIGEFSFIIAGVGLATGAIRPFLYPVAISVAAVTTLTTPWFISRSGALANYIDRRLPRPLQTFVALYDSWMEAVRQKTGTHPGVRRTLLLIMADAVLIAVIVIGVSLELPRLTGMLSNVTGLQDSATRAMLVVAAAVVAAPLALGLARSAHLLANALALRAFPASDPQRIDYAVAPRRALQTTLQLGVIGLAGVIVVAATQPFLPPLRGLVLLALVTAVLGIAFWRSAINLEGHARAGAQIVAAALAQQLPTSEPSTAEKTRTPLDELLSSLGQPVAMTVEPGASGVGKTLTGLNLRGLTGATVLAIHRNGGDVLLPTGKERLNAGDVVILAGTHHAIEAAQDLLK